MYRVPLSGGVCFQNFVRNPVHVNTRFQAPFYLPQILASNMAKNHPDNVNPMLALRVVRANNWWDEFWQWRWDQKQAQVGM
jgi:hypothetical protein